MKKLIVGLALMLTLPTVSLAEQYKLKGGIYKVGSDIPEGLYLFESDSKVTICPSADTLYGKYGSGSPVELTMDLFPNGEMRMHLDDGLYLCVVAPTILTSQEVEVIN